MCTMSMVGDHFRDWTLPNRHPWVVPMTPTPVLPAGWPFGGEGTREVTHPTREEFDALKHDVEDLKALLKRAKDYDERNGEPDCEMDEKMDLLRKVAKLVGIDLNDVIKPKEA